MHLEVRDCAGVDAGEVERLLEIELGPLAAPRTPGGAIQVALACAGSRLNVTARDPIMNRPLVREVAVGPPEPGRDRTIALLVSQLFLTSWAEEFLEHPGPRPPAANGQGPTLARRSPPPPGPPGPTWELQIQAGPRLHNGSSPALGARAAVAASRRAGPLRVLATASLEHGSADRAAGAVVWTIGEVGAGISWRSRRRGRLAFDASLTGAAALAQARGDAGATAAAGSSVRGVLGEVALAAGPRLVWDRLRLGLDVEVGATFPEAEARVSGDHDLTLSGAWAGASLAIGWGLR